MRQQLDTAIRLSLAGQIRNRFAWILLVAFVPVWYLLLGSMFAHTGAAFRLRATGTTVVVDGHNLTLITAGLNSITLLTAFVVFAAVRRSRPFDRRLVLSGYRPAALIAAKTSAALVQAVSVGAYAAIVMLLFWRPSGAWTIAAAFMLAAATYAALGLLIGVLVRGDLEGFFLIIMVSLLDTFLQNPVGNPLANKPILEFFPSYGPTQFAVAGAFDHRILASMAALSLAWTAAFALLGLAVMRLRMPRPSRVTVPALDRQAPSTDTQYQTLTAAVAQASGGSSRNPDGSGLPADQRVVPPPAARAG
jgi:ABC-2 type transport system permease protein